MDSIVTFVSTAMSYCCKQTLDQHWSKDFYNIIGHRLKVCQKLFFTNKGKNRKHAVHLNTDGVKIGAFYTIFNVLQI
jgi:hypothetical protein